MSNNQSIIQKQTIKQVQKINHSYINSLKIMSMSNEQLLAHLKNIMQENPFIEYTPNIKTQNSSMSALDLIHTEITLQEDLLHQLHVCREQHSTKICTFIIESLNDQGFLSYSIDDYCSILNISKDKFIYNLKIVQSFEPTGVAAENVIDCLKLQLIADNQSFPLEILTNFQNEILSGKLELIAQKCGATVEEIYDSLSIIKTLNPYPCSNYCKKEASYVYPDIKIDISDNNLVISPIEYGEWKYNEDYYSSIKNHPRLKKYFEEAMILLSDVEKRNATLLLISNELINIQKDYFLLGKPLKRCTLQDISSKLGIHNSTVSRCINNKYYEFENRVYPLKSLFISKKVKDLSDPLQNAIRKLILKENPSQPYSDYQLYILLKKQGFNISRRTIAKYRNIMKIENSSKRKKEYLVDQ